MAKKKTDNVKEIQAKKPVEKKKKEVKLIDEITIIEPIKNSSIIKPEVIKPIPAVQIGNNQSEALIRTIDFDTEDIKMAMFKSIIPNNTKVAKYDFEFMLN